MSQEKKKKKKNILYASREKEKNSKEIFELLSQTTNFGRLN